MLIGLTTAAILMATLEPEGVVATAPRGVQAVPAATAETLAATTSSAIPSTTVQSAAPHSLTTEQQIARWIGNRPGTQTADYAGLTADPWAEVGPREVHGEVSVGMGTGGYRDYAAAVSLPLGDSGTLNLSLRQSKNAPWSYGYGQYGYGGGWNDGGYGRPFGLIEPLGYEGSHYRGASQVPFWSPGRSENGESTSVGVSLQLGHSSRLEN